MPIQPASIKSVAGRVEIFPHNEGTPSGIFNFIFLSFFQIQLMMVRTFFKHDSPTARTFVLSAGYAPYMRYTGITMNTDTVFVFLKLA